MFSKQHFDKKAKLAINSEAQTKTEFIKEMAEMFKADNQRFNTEKFFSKAGLCNNRIWVKLLKSNPFDKKNPENFGS